MKFAESKASLATLHGQIVGIRKQMHKIRSEIEPQIVSDYPFDSARGKVKLSELFGAKSELFVVHNMGKNCPYCTLWADGYNGVYEHLADRAAFVVSSPDAPAIQSEFAKSRGWRFPMVSHQGTDFAADMGYRGPEGGYMPGVSVFQKKGDRILRVSESPFGPGDDFCALWHFFDLLPAGPGEWHPKYRYDRAG
jgi:predicted dithiol-disulfide oxidoreductase (DUF899 family)